MLGMLKAGAVFLSTTLSAAAVVAPIAIWAFNSYAEDIIDQRVGARLNQLEQAAQDRETHVLIQGQKLNNIYDIQVEQRDVIAAQREDIAAQREDIRDLQRDIRALLIELQKD